MSETTAFPAQLAGWRGTGRPLLAGHRGAEENAPENTMAAFVAAAGLGADVIEIDVQLTSDAVPAVIHDERLDRTTDASGPVRAHSWRQLSELDAGSWFGAGFRGERVPQLREVLDWAARNDVRLLVELKASPVFDPDIVPAVVDVFGTGTERDDVILYSSDHLVVEELARQLPGIARGVVVNERTRFLPGVLEATKAGLLSQSTWCLTPDTVRYCHDTGRLVSAEARYPSDIGLLAAWGVDVIVSARTPLSRLIECVRGEQAC